MIFVFDPWRSAILVGGDKSGDWSGWYRRATPRAEELYVEYVKEREAEEGSDEVREVGRCSCRDRC